MNSFNDPEAVARYAENPPRLVPGFTALQRMTLILMEEAAPADAQILVIGAGGGLELKVFAEAQPDWGFTGVDPSAAMLKLAVDVMGPLGARVDWHEGYVETAPAGPFDAATALLTLHFLDTAERLRTLEEIHTRLKPGAPLIVAHHSVPDQANAREIWLKRFAAFAANSGVDREKAELAGRTLNDKLPIHTPEQDEQLLSDAGFSDVSQFYAAFTFRGWIGYA